MQNSQKQMKILGEPVKMSASLIPKLDKLVNTGKEPDSLTQKEDLELAPMKTPSQLKRKKKLTQHLKLKAVKNILAYLVEQDLTDEEIEQTLKSAARVNWSYTLRQVRREIEDGKIAQKPEKKSDKKTKKRSSVSGKSSGK